MNRFGVSGLGLAALVVVLLVACQPAGSTASESTPSPSEAESSTAASTPEATLSASTPAFAPEDEAAFSWPETGPNHAGVYSWDGSSCAGPFCNVGFMHNGYGSGDVEITIGRVAGGSISGPGWIPATVAGHDGHYRRIDGLREEWMVEIEGTTVAIHLEAKGLTSQADLDEAHAIIDSLRAQKRDNGLGFRLLFTLTTDDWDSG